MHDGLLRRLVEDCVRRLQDLDLIHGSGGGNDGLEDDDPFFAELALDFRVCGFDSLDQQRRPDTAARTKSGLSAATGTDLSVVAVAVVDASGDFLLISVRE